MKTGEKHLKNVCHFPLFFGIQNDICFTGDKKPAKSMELRLSGRRNSDEESSQYVGISSAHGLLL